MNNGKPNWASDDLPGLRRLAPNSAGQVQYFRWSHQVAAIEVELDTGDGQHDSSHRVQLTRPRVPRRRRARSLSRGRHLCRLVKRAPRYLVRRRPTR